MWQFRHVLSFRGKSDECIWRDKDRQAGHVGLKERQVGSSRGRLTRTLFSVLSPLISSLTLFLSDSFTFLPTASRTLSEHRRQERTHKLSFGNGESMAAMQLKVPYKTTFIYHLWRNTSMDLKTWGGWGCSKETLITPQLLHVIGCCQGSRPLLLHVFQHPYFASLQLYL